MRCEKSQLVLAKCFALDVWKSFLHWIWLVFPLAIGRSLIWFVFLHYLSHVSHTTECKAKKMHGLKFTRTRCKLSTGARQRISSTQWLLLMVWHSQYISSRMILRIQILTDPTVCLLQWSAFGVGAPGAHLQVSLVQPNRTPINMAQTIMQITPITGHNQKKCYFICMLCIKADVIIQVCLSWADQVEVVQLFKQLYGIKRF